MPRKGHIAKRDVLADPKYGSKQVSINRRIDQEDMIHIYRIEYYSTVKRNEVLPLATTWMDLEGVRLSKISQRKTNTLL